MNEPAIAAQPVHKSNQWPGMLADTLTLLAVVVAIWSPSIWGRLYYQNNSAGFLASMLLCAMAGILFALWLASRLTRRTSFQRLLRSATLGLGALCVGVVLAGGTLPRSPLAWLVPLGIVVATIGHWRLGGNAGHWWPRVRVAMLTGATLLFFSAPLLGSFVSRDLAMFGLATGPARVPTVWLLLDETSFGAAEQLAAPLQSLGLAVSVHALQPAGSNTLDIVPSFLRRSVMGPSTAPCGPTSLCAAGGSVDFSRIVAGREGVDVVGIHHRYCAIRGLRSCVKPGDTELDWATQLQALVCAVQPALRRVDHPTVRACRERSVQGQLDGRLATVRAAFDAPFWTQGGDLYVHILLPHLPVSVQPQPSLGAAYESNIGAAAGLLEEIARRLVATFPDDFRLVVFSDHPLREAQGCGALYSGNCERPPRFAEPYTVPLIVVSPRMVEVTAPVSNLNILDLQTQEVGLK